MTRVPLLPVFVVAGLGLTALLGSTPTQAAPASAFTCCWRNPPPTWTSEPTPPTEPDIPTPTPTPPTNPGSPTGRPGRPTTPTNPGTPGGTTQPSGPTRMAAGTDWHSWWVPARLAFWAPRERASTPGATATDGDTDESWRARMARCAEGRAIWSERGALAEGLAYVHDPGLLELAFKLVADRNDQVSRLGVFAAAAQMQGDPSALSALSHVLEDSAIDPHARGAAAASLGALGDPAACHVLWPKVRSRTEGAVRVGALIGLGGIAPAESLPQIERIVLDRREDTPVRTAAAVALGWCAKRDATRSAATRSLLKVSANPKALDADVRQTVALNLGHAEATALVWRRLTAWVSGDSDLRTRAMAALALGRLARRDSAALEPCRRALVAQWDAEPPSVKAFLALGLGLAGATNERRRLEAWLDGRGDPLHRGSAAIALGLLGDPAVQPALEKAARSGPPQLRADATEALGLLGGPTATVLLRKLVKDKDSAVRAAAAYALGCIGQAQDFETIVEVLLSRNRMDRSGAAFGLGAFGGERARDALLLATAEESDPSVRSLTLFGAALAVAPRPLAAPAKDVDRSPWARDH